jgi:hypothetical protein
MVSAPKHVWNKTRIIAWNLRQADENPMGLSPASSVPGAWTMIPGLTIRNWRRANIVQQHSGNDMNIFAYRKHLRFLSHVHRRQWWDQRKRLSPRVRISGAYVPPNVSREFAYIKVG